MPLSYSTILSLLCQNINNKPINEKIYHLLYWCIFFTSRKLKNIDPLDLPKVKLWVINHCMKYGSLPFLDVRKYNVFVCLIMDILSFQLLFRKYHLSKIMVRKDEIIVPKYYENKKYSWVPENKKYSYLFCYENSKYSFPFMYEYIWYSWFSNIRNIRVVQIRNIVDFRKYKIFLPFMLRK